MKKLKLPYKIVLFNVPVICLFIGLKNVAPSNLQNDQAVTTDAWNLIFEEEFNDLSAWNIWYGGAFNKEIQLYREEQLSLDNGILKINAERKSVKGPTRPSEPTIKNFEYVSGRIESKQLFGPSDKDGERAYKFVARMKLPFGPGASFIIIQG